MHKRYYLIIAASCWLVAIIGCVAFLSSCAGGPKLKTPLDRSLFFTIQYENLEETYKSQYRYSTPEQKIWLRENVAKPLDDLRAAVIIYGNLVTAGGESEAQRIKVIDMIRDITLDLTRR